MNTSRKKRTIKSIIFMALYQVTVFACNLILPRLIISNYGSEYNGIIGSITQFLNLVSILRLGVAGATRYELYKSLEENDINKTSSIIKATENFMRKIASIFLIPLIVFSIFYPFMIETSHSWKEVASLAFIIGIGTFSQYFFGLTYQTLLQADQRLYIYNIIQIIFNLINTIVSCVLIKLNFSIHIVKFVTVILFTISPIILNIFVSKIYKINKNVVPDKTALNKKNDVMAHSIANIVHENTDVIVLTLLANVKVVSVYTVYNLIINGLKQLLLIFTSSLESIFGSLWVKKDFEKMNTYLTAFEYLINLFVSIVFSCSFVLIIPFVKIYTLGVTDIEYVIPAYGFLVLVAQMFYCYRIPSLTVTQAAGKYKETKNGAFVEAFLNIFLSVILTFKFGILGVVLGTLAANIFRTVQYIIFVSKNIIKRNNIKCLLGLCWSWFNIIVSIGCFYIFKFNNILNNLNWLSWLLGGIVIAFISIFVTLLNTVIFYRTQLLNIKKLLKR